MNAQRDLLEAVIAAPDDDAPRRVYADALLDAGEPQGELIHVQCDLGRGGLTREEAIARRRRERALLREHTARWTAGLAMAGSPRFRRGFVDELSIDIGKWVTHHAAMIAAAPALRAVRLTGLTVDAHDPRDTGAAAGWVVDTVRAALAVPALARLQGLGCEPMGVRTGPDDRWTDLEGECFGLLATANLPLRALEVTRLPAAAIPTLVHGLDRLAIGAADLEPVLAALDPTRLTGLSIGDTHPTITRFERMRDFAVTAGTDELVVPPNLARFSYQTNQLTDARCQRIATSPDLVNLRALHLVDSGQTVGAWRQLAKAGFAELQVLGIETPDFGAAEARELLTWPIANCLEVLRLDVTDAEAAALEQRFGVIIERAANLPLGATVMGDPI